MFLRLAIFLLILKFVVSGPHSHKVKNGFREKVEDGLFASRDSKHYTDGKHNHDFDHEAVLGSHDAAEEFDHLPSAEAKNRLLRLALKMDANEDKFVDKKELTNWVLRSFKMLTQEEALDEFEDEDVDEDGKVTWEEHTAEAYEIYEDDKLIVKDLPEDSQVYENDKELFKAADLNEDGILSKSEFPAYSHPEEFEHMHEIVYNQAMRKRDKDKDGFLSFMEFIDDTYGANPVPSTEHYIMEKDRFGDFDANGDKKLNREEVISWLIPNNVESAENEAEHLIESSDTDKDGKLSLDEIVQHYYIFVGSEATDFGEQLHNFHKFSDEL